MKAIILVSAMISGLIIQGCGSPDDSSDLSWSRFSRGEGIVGKYINYEPRTDGYYYAYRSNSIGSSAGIKAATDYVINNQKTLESGTKHVVTLNDRQMLTFGYMNNSRSDRIWVELWLSDGSIMLDRKRSSGPVYETDETVGGNTLQEGIFTNVSTFGRFNDLTITYLGKNRVEISRSQR